MEKEFIHCEIALKLKEIGFNEPCLKYMWNDKNHSQYMHNASENKTYHFQNNFTENDKIFTVSVPTFSQAFRWFRDKYNLDSFVKHLYKSTINVGYYFGIDYNGIEFQMDLDDYYKTYEEAELECLKKLIEIVNKNNL